MRLACIATDHYCIVANVCGLARPRHRNSQELRGTSHVTVVSVHSSKSLSSAHRELQRVTDDEPAEMALKWTEMSTCFQKKTMRK